MKKTIILTAMLIASLNIFAQSHTLSNKEIVECKTPEGSVSSSVSGAGLTEPLDLQI